MEATRISGSGKITWSSSPAVWCATFEACTGKSPRDSKRCARASESDSRPKKPLSGVFVCAVCDADAVQRVAVQVDRRGRAANVLLPRGNARTIAQAGCPRGAVKAERLQAWHQVQTVPHTISNPRQILRRPQRVAQVMPLGLVRLMLAERTCSPGPAASLPGLLKRRPPGAKPPNRKDNRAKMQRGSFCRHADIA